MTNLGTEIKLTFLNILHTRELGGWTQASEHKTYKREFHSLQEKVTQSNGPKVRSAHITGVLYLRSIH